MASIQGAPARTDTTAAMIKGAQPRAALELLRKKAGDAAVAAVMSLLDDSDREILSLTGLSTRWVTMDTYVRFLRALVKVAYNGDEKGLIVGTIKLVEIELVGIYKAFTLISSPVELIQRLAAINQTYFKNVTTKTHQEGPASFLVTYCGLAPQHRIFENTLVGWWSKMVAATRGANAKVRVVKSIAAGGSEVTFAVQWE
jgi:hypothetical protein